jgi:hypothetical protein
MKKFFYVLVVLLLPALASAETLYISQGGGTVSCGSWGSQSTQSAAWFNTAANWGGGAGEIDPGDTVRFCGTVTTNLTVQASGTSGNNIVFDGTGATLNARFNGDYRQYFTFQNVTFTSGRTGPVMYFQGASYLTISNVTAQNVVGDEPLELREASYVTVDQLNLDGLDTWGIHMRLAHHITLSRLHIVTATTASSAQKDIITSYGANNITLEKSFIHSRLVGTTSTAKNDIWETGCSDGRWNIDPCPGTYSYNNTIRYNLFIAEKSGIINHNYYLSGPNYGGDKIYGNVFVDKGTNYVAQYIVYASVGHDYSADVYNNTFVAIENRPTNAINVYAPFGSDFTVNLRNNIFHNAYSSGDAIAGSANVIFNNSHNIWNGFKSNGWVGGTCAAWAGTGEVCNTDPLFLNYDNDDFSLRESSIAMYAGIDLGSEYKQQLKPGSTWPNPTLITPSIMNIGAYGNDTSSTKRPMPPDIAGIN